MEEHCCPQGGFSGGWEDNPNNGTCPLCSPPDNNNTPVKYTEELDKALQRIQDGEPHVYVPYLVKDEALYDEIGKTLCIHMSYHEPRDPKYMVQIWKPTEYCKAFGKTADERVKQWNEMSVQQFRGFQKRTSTRKPIDESKGFVITGDLSLPDIPKLE